MKELIIRKSADGSGIVEIVGELIRCKDCKYYQMDKFNTFFCHVNIKEIQPTDYCSDAERKEK